MIEGGIKNNQPSPVIRTRAVAYGISILINTTLINHQELLQLSYQLLPQAGCMSRGRYSEK